MREKIHELLETHRYNEDLMPELLKCLDAQVADGWYDVDANLAILKQYQFRPTDDFVKTEVISKILALSLCQLPAPDFRLALCLIPERFQGMKEIGVMNDMHSALQSANFEAFWKLSDENPEFAYMVPAFTKSARKYILRCLRACFHVTNAEVLCEALHLKGAELGAFLGECGLSIGHDDKVVLPCDKENQEKTTGFDENVQLSEVAELVKELIA